MVKDTKKYFCGHECIIHHIYPVINKNRDKVLLTGCDCICKTGIETKNEIEKNNHKRKVDHFKSKNDISNIEYAGGNRTIDAQYYTAKYDDTTILNYICCDVCKTKANTKYFFILMTVNVKY